MGTVRNGPVGIAILSFDRQIFLENVFDVQGSRYDAFFEQDVSGILNRPADDLLAEEVRVTQILRMGLLFRFGPDEETKITIVGVLLLQHIGNGKLTSQGGQDSSVSPFAKGVVEQGLVIADAE